MLFMLVCLCVALASILILVALCFVLPTLPVRWGFLILAGSAAAIVAIQFFLALSFADAIVRFAVITVVVTCAYLLVIATRGWLRLRRENRYLQRYAPSQVVDHYLSLPTDRSAGGLQDMTIMFCDIKSFTGISERLDPEQLPGWLNRFFDVERNHSGGSGTFKETRSRGLTCYGGRYRIVDRKSVCRKPGVA